MIIKVKVKHREEQKGEEYEFRGPDAMERMFDAMLTKYGVRTLTFI